jgi:mersacidin/lichenicidin family type 2 lantibiotic
MSTLDIIRAWKDEEYRLSLDEMPAHPAGLIELTDADLELVAGGNHSSHGSHHHHSSHS